MYFHCIKKKERETINHNSAQTIVVTFNLYNFARFSLYYKILKVNPKCTMWIVNEEESGNPLGTSGILRYHTG